MMQDTKTFGKRANKKGGELHDKPVEIPEKYPQGRCGEISNDF